MTKNLVSILIVDDENAIRNTLSSILLDEGFKVITASDGSQAIEMVRTELPNIVLLDVWLPDIDGLEVLKKIKEIDSNINVVVMSGHGTVKTAVQAVRLGAFDFMEKPLSVDKILVTINNVMTVQSLTNENEVLKKKMKKRYSIIGRSTSIEELKGKLALAAPTQSSVLIFGENGSGKELVAREIHALSNRANKAFIDLNCAAIPEELIESELFGHEKGSFTGAQSMKRGKFDLANGGTLFLDEIGDMSLKTQAKILRILQEQSFERVGGAKSIQVDVRIIAATNKNLLEAIKNGTFREDLYYRLNVIPLKVPPLRERKDDIPLIIQYFNSEYSTSYGKKQKVFTENAQELLKNYTWPGNVRELRNVIEHIIIMSLNEVITEKDIPGYLNSPMATLNNNNLKEESYFKVEDLKEAKDLFEKEYIKRRLDEFDGNIAKTAEEIGIERSHLYKKIKQYEITN